jgi:hypothetical protein
MEAKKLLKFEHDGKNYAMMAPTHEKLLEMDLKFRQAFSEAVRIGLMTEFEAKRIFEKNGTWTSENDKELTELQMAIVHLEMELDKIEDGDAGRLLAFDIMDKRNQLLEMINYKSRLFSAQTVEGYAESIKIATLTYLCTVDEKGELVFPTREAFYDHSDTELAATCYSKAMLVNAGMTEEDLKVEFSERDWLNDKGYVNKEGSFTEKYYEALVEGSMPKDEKEAKPTKKRAKRKVAKKRTKKRPK